MRGSCASRVRAAMRPGFLLIIVTVACISLGCATGRTGAPGGRAADAVVSPDWNTLGIRTLAFMGVGTAGLDEVIRATAEQIIDDQLHGGQERFVVIGKDEGRAKAVSAGSADLFDKVVRVWKNSRVADQLLVHDLCGKLGVDGLILADLTEWKAEKVDWNTEGSSSTQVALRLVILSAKTGTVAWEAEKLARRESLRYSPGQAGSGIYTDAGGASRTERANSLTPDAPRPEEVAVEAMDALMLAFPPRAESR